MRARTAAVIAVGMVAASPINGGPAKRDVDSVLDRLEQRLMDQDRESLSFGDQPSKAPAQKAAPTKFQYQPRDITPRYSEEEQITQIAHAVTELETDVDGFAGEVQRLKQKILEDVAIDNFVTIAAQVEAPDATTIRTLRLRLDGYTVYTIDEVAGLWLPRPVIPFYSGPLTPGTHKLELDAKLGRRNGDGVPLGDDTFQVIQQTFALNVPDGKARKSWVIALKTPEKGKTKGVAELAEKTIE